MVATDIFREISVFPYTKIYRKKFEKSWILYFFNHLFDYVCNDIHKLKTKFENFVTEKNFDEKHVQNSR